MDRLADPWIGLNSIEAEYMHGGSTEKRSKLEYMDSIFTDNPFLGLSDRVVSDNHFCPDRIGSLRDYFSLESTDTYGEGFVRTCHDNNLTDAQIVPVHEYENKQPNRKLSKPDEPKTNDNWFAQAKTRNCIESTSIEPTNRYESITGLQNQPNSIENVESKLPYRNDRIRERSLEEKVEPRVVTSSSACSSHRASNNLAYTLKRRYEEDTDEWTTNISESVDEESESEMDVKSGWRNRKVKACNLFERKRRRKLDKKMHALQELIPNCNKVDRVSMLDDAIEYLKTLQLQIQMMSMRRFCMPPRMMLPFGMQQPFPHPSMMSFGCGPPPFLASPISGPTFLPGFSGQVVPMSSSSSPFLPFLGGSSTQSMMVQRVPICCLQRLHFSSRPCVEFSHLLAKMTAVEDSCLLAKMTTEVRKKRRATPGY